MAFEPEGLVCTIRLTLIEETPNRILEAEGITFPAR